MSTVSEAKMKGMLIVLLLACGTAQAADWIRISAKGVPVQEYVDRSSIQVDGNRRTAWVRYTFKANTHIERKKAVASSVELTDVLCDSKEVRLLSITLFYEDGSSDHDAAARQWEPIPPETGSDDAMKYLCKLSSGEKKKEAPQ